MSGLGGKILCVRYGRGAVSVRCPEYGGASASWRFLKYFFYGSFNPFLAACLFLGGCPLLGRSVMGGSTVYIHVSAVAILP